MFIVNSRKCISSIRRCTRRCSMRKNSSLQSSKELQQYYDLVIVGAGMVGSALACAMSKSDLLKSKSVLVVEAAPDRHCPDDLKSHGYSNRVSAISPSSQRLLEELSAWQHIVNIRAKPFTQMHVWDSCSDGAVTFGSGVQNSEDVIATIVENPVILDSLHKSLKSEQSNVDFAFQTTVAEMKSPHMTNSPDKLVDVTLDNGHTLKTSLLVGADGYNSRIRKLANMRYFEKKYSQFGVVATVVLAQEQNNNVAWQRFHPSGPIALLPLTSTQSSLVWSTSKSHAKSLAKVSPAAFVDALNHGLQESPPTDPLTDVISSGMQTIMSTIQPGLYAGSQRSKAPAVQNVEPKSRSIFPYGLGHAENYVNSRIALMGDAAHRIHPLAGQGVNLGFGDVACLCGQLEHAVSIGDDLGYLKHLLEYESQRQRHVVPMMLGIDFLNRIFSTDAYGVALVRALGMQTVNSMTPLKDSIASFARQ